MKQSYFCEPCEIMHSEVIFFNNCTILVRLLRVDSCYRRYLRSRRILLEIIRYRRDVHCVTNFRIDGVFSDYNTALSHYLFVVQRYKHYYNLETTRIMTAYFNSLSDDNIPF